MSKGALDPEVRKFIYEMNGMEDREPTPKTEEEREAFRKHLEKVNAELLRRLEERKKAQNGTKMP